ncbi:MAG TPA: hypothetical protein VER12_21020 [Polyangiaceae bacterium]|nr:hypothetical protein [Polyangiaceae bacterium]HYQ29482.1 hypothetical protein [Polyangiaceae bacterium]
MRNRALARHWVFGIGLGSLLLLAVVFFRTTTGSAIAQGLVRMAHGGCPFGYDRALSPVQRERAHAKFAATHRGQRRALGRPALGFTLDGSTRAEVLAAMSAAGVQCLPGHGMSDLTCSRVPSAALPGAAAGTAERSLWFTFGSREQLLSVISVSRDASAQTISTAFISVQDGLNRQAGLASSSSGSADSQALAQGLLQQASAEFRFQNYYALERAANMGDAYVLTEEYRSLPD